MKEKFKKYKVILIGTFVLFIFILILLFCIFFLNKHEMKDFSNAIYSLQYDNTWKLKAKEEDTALLTHGKNAKVKIDIQTLDESNRYNDISTFVNDVKNMIQKNNQTYQLIYQNQDVVTKRDLDGYTLLYEGEDSQSYVVLSKYNDKLFTIFYEANNDEFDILLDSVDTIVDSFSIQDETFDLEGKKEEIKLTGITYTSDTFNLSKKKTERQIADDNYVVQFKLSEDLPKDDFNSYSYSGDYEVEEYKEVNFYITLSPLNIYEYLTKNLLRKEESYKKIDDYKNVKAEIDEIDNNGYKGYIYKISHEYEAWGLKDDGSSGDKTVYDEEYYVLYEIDPITTLVCQVDGEKGLISEELISNLEITNTQKYGAYITRTISDDKLINEMKILTSDTKYSDQKQYYKVTLYTPKEYYERYYDNNNIYDSRYFGMDYNEASGEYNTKVHYWLTASPIDSCIRTAKFGLDSYQDFSFEYVRDITVNKNTFKYYQASYTSGGKKQYKSYLFLEILNEEGSHNTLYLEISTEDGIMDIDKIEGLLNMKIERLDYE